VVGRRTCDLGVAGSRPGCDATDKRFPTDVSNIIPTNQQSVTCDKLLMHEY